MALSMLVGLGPGPIVLDGEWGPSYPPPPKKMGQSPLFWAHFWATVYTSSTVAEMGDRDHNRHGPKRGGAVPLSLELGPPSSTMWPEPRSTSVSSGVFIHPAIWSQ